MAKLVVSELKDTKTSWIQDNELVATMSVAADKLVVGYEIGTGSLLEDMKLGGGIGRGAFEVGKVVYDVFEVFVAFLGLFEVR